MTVTKSVALALTLAVAGALTHASAGGPDTVPRARLKSITLHVDSGAASLVVEASEPVPYVTTRPDPLTVVLEFRDVDVQGVTSKVAVNAKSPIAGVTLENADAPGAPSSRVRIALSEAAAYRVRSEKNSVIVEFQKANGKSVPYVMPPVTRDVPDVVQQLAGGASGIPDPITALNLQTLTPGRAAAAPSQAVIVQPAPQQPPATPPAVPETSPVPGEKKYTGNPINLDFQDADLKSVLRVFAQETGLNLLMDNSVQGTVNVQLTAVPWDQALDLILRANKLGYIVDGTVVRIASLAALADEEGQRQKLTDAQALSGELRFLTKTLSYAKAAELAPLLTRTALSARGTVQVDLRTNTLIITDLAARLTTVNDLIAILDKPQPQVEIEARIVQVNKTYARSMGIQWGFSGLVAPALGNGTSLAFPNSGALTGAVPGTTANTVLPTGTQPTVVNLPATAATTAIGLALGSVNGAFNLDAQLSAAESSGKLRLLSTPRVSTQNNIEAEITQGVKLPYQTVANNTVTTTFTNAALSLKVTPQITAAGTVIMKIAVDNGSVGASYNGVPSINTQGATTTVLVNDGQTTVIGGIYQSSDNTTKNTTPGLGSIPLLKWLFKSDSLTDSTTELLIFITPRIIKG
jgi:type IV pilus secretin PilQ/predicted competence protein